MRFGLFTMGYQRNPLEDCFIDAKRFGYDYVELWGARPHAYAFDLKDGYINEVRRFIKKYQMPVFCYTPEINAYPYNFMIGSESQRKDSLDYLKLCLDMTKLMDSPYMLVSASHAGYNVSDSDIWDRLVSSLKTLTEYAEKIGVTILFEPLTSYESNVINTANQLERLLLDIPSKNLAGMCDIVPPYTLNESIMAYFTKLGDKMQHMHIIDGVKGSDDHIMPGDGTIPLKYLFSELKNQGYEGSATIELVTGYINEPRMYSHMAIDRIRRLMKESSD